jgi:DNA-directed RNA polymerase subunit N (RpoN/RPB10)
LYVLAEAGVSIDRLLDDLFLSPDTCCVREIVLDVPEVSMDFKNRLDVLKAITLVDPPPYYLISPNEREVRVRYHNTTAGLVPTNVFLGAELYYYLVERGENPATILNHLGIHDRIDRDTILANTDRPSNEFECTHCGEYIPHAKFLNYLYTNRVPRPEELLPPPDLPTQTCCKENILRLRLTDEEVAEAEVLTEDLISNHPGVPLIHLAHEACTSCGNEDVSKYNHYEWLVHHGIPPVVALNYFGLRRLCCRQTMMNPRTIVRESQAVLERRLRQESEIPPEPSVDFNYAERRLPRLI